MATNYNPDTIAEIRESIKIQSIDPVPPLSFVVDVNPKHARLTNLVARHQSTSSSASNTTLLTAATGKNTFLTGFRISMTKDSACDVASGVWGIQYTPDGQSTALIFGEVSRLTLTAQDVHVTLSLRDPIKVKEGSVVAATTFSYTVGTSSRTCSVFGYEVDKY